jgi:phage-related minor tail protein
VLPFATGGVVNSPRTFPMANGATGLMGEAGPEAIMPLGRDGLGRLGVRTTGAAGGDSAGLREEVRTLRAAVEALTALVARQHQQAQRAREAIADATERTAEGTEANADTSQLNRMRARA